MADREALERELEELRERLSREDRLRARREDLSRQAEELRERKAALGEVLAKEEADVDALEGMSLQAILQTVLGRKEERLEQERREAVAARLKYQDACRALEDVEARYLEAAGQLDQLRLDRRRYEALLEEKRALLKAEDPALARHILDLEEALSAARAFLKEVDEALSAGRAASWALSRAAGELSSAESWGFYDMLGGGLIATAVKHGHIDDARQAAGEAQVLLSRFRTELSDVQVSARLTLDMGELATFFDYVFDDFFSDWVVQSRIQDAQAGVSATAGQVDALLARLEGTRADALRRQASLEEELRTLTEGA